MGKLDSHCSQCFHAAGCKMDRSLKHGTIGLAMLWLSTTELDKEGHDMQKAILSDVGKLKERKEKRAEFVRIAEAQGGDYLLVLAREKELRGTSDEPANIPCRSALSR